MTKLTAVIYIRVSTEDQATEGVSIDAQHSKLTAWCFANDYELIESFTDAGISGGRADNRPGLQSAIELACSTASALVVYSLSRLARSTKDTIAIGELLEKSGADLVSLSEKIDTTSAAGKMIFRMLAVMAEFEKDQVSERTRFAMAHKKSKGERVGTIPYGYDLKGDGVNLVENSSEQEVIGLMASLRNSGRSYRAIAAELESRGVLTKSGKSNWDHKTVSNIVKATAA
ncbi:recombinase family protein [Aureliella helgolandensis]|uniref:DNA-invertase hin n=1 Tax=Aureliella helgolandensis TaxID=2527968 RepID=A0A518GFK2_9BACT|nr:recombinase family protein [Aureliella helgolandensis]QDV27376.1 DNA-invertase hin [Aureliella helgolandensis]